MTVLAWHNDPALKAEALARMQAHRAADEFILGEYIEADPRATAGFKGCFHGCLTAERLAAEKGMTPAEFAKTRPWRAWHDEGERLWGIPAELGGLLDDTFEELDSVGDSAEFAVASVDAVAVGADLSGVVDRYTEESPADDETDAMFVLRLLREAPIPGASS
jgi:hypothetical protein